MNDAAPSTPMLDKIPAADTAGDSYDVRIAFYDIMPAAERWVGRDIELVCDHVGWSVRYTHGNNYRDRLTPRYTARFPCSEDAIQALHDLIVTERTRIERRVCGEGL